MASVQPLAPQNLDAEESVIGAMMISTKAIDAVMDDGLQARDFYRPSHGMIFDAIVTLYSAGEAADAITVADKLATQQLLAEAGGADRVQELASLVPAAGNARHYARLVREHALYRRFIAAGTEIARLGYERPGEPHELLDAAEQHLYELASTGRRRGDDFVTVKEALRDVWQRMEEAQARGEDIVGLATGLRRIDELTAGLEPGNLVVLAARPSMGKSGLALNIIQHVAVRHQQPVALFTLEMSRGEVTQRLLASEAGVDSRKIRTGQRIHGDDWQKLLNAAGRIDAAPLQIDDGGAVTAMELRAKARRLKIRYPNLALVVVDYIQLMTSGQTRMNDNRVQDISQISRALKVLAGELEVPVLALSQLSRAVEQRHDKRPVLSDLRESGSIEQDADIVMFIYRDEYYNPEDTDQEGIAEVLIAKNRNGATGTAKLAFVKRFVRFTDLAEEPS